MTNPAANMSITALSHWEIQELIANAPHPCPLAALCDRRGWRRPSMADHAFIDACADRLATRLALTLAKRRAARAQVHAQAPTGLKTGDPVTITSGASCADGFAVDGLAAIPE